MLSPSGGHPPRCRYMVEMVAKVLIRGRTKRKSWHEKTKGVGCGTTRRGIGHFMAELLFMLLCLLLVM